MESATKKRTRNFYGLETYLDFPRMNWAGNPDLQTFAKKNELVDFLNATPDEKIKRIKVSGSQALSFGKRTNWRPENVFEEMQRLDANIQYQIQELRKAGRVKIGVKPFLSWKCGKIHLLPLSYPLNIKNIMKIIAIYSRTLFDKKPEVLPPIKFECRIIGAFNLRDFTDDNDCQTVFYSTDFSPSLFLMDK